MAIRLDPDDLHTTFGVLKALYLDRTSQATGEDFTNLRGVIGQIALRLYGDDRRNQRMLDALVAHLQTKNAETAAEVKRVAAELFPPTPAAT